MEVSEACSITTLSFLAGRALELLGCRLGPEELPDQQFLCQVVGCLSEEEG